jgi:hypothetical protein
MTTPFSDKDESRQTTFLGVGTYIQFGVLISIIGGTWYVSQNLSALAGQVGQLNNAIIALSANDKSQADVLQDLSVKVAVIDATGSPGVRELQVKMIEFEKVGSPALVPRILALEKEVMELKMKAR